MNSSNSANNPMERSYIKTQTKIPSNSNISRSYREQPDYTCPTCKFSIDTKKCPLEKFEKHIIACKNSFGNGK